MIIRFIFQYIAMYLADIAYEIFITYIQGSELL